MGYKRLVQIVTVRTDRLYMVSSENLVIRYAEALSCSTRPPITSKGLGRGSEVPRRENRMGPMMLPSTGS